MSFLWFLENMTFFKTLILLDAETFQWAKDKC